MGILGLHGVRFLHATFSAALLFTPLVFVPSSKAVPTKKDDGSCLYQSVDCVTCGFLDCCINPLTCGLTKCVLGLPEAAIDCACTAGICAGGCGCACAAAAVSAPFIGTCWAAKQTKKCCARTNNGNCCKPGATNCCSKMGKQPDGHSSRTAAEKLCRNPVFVSYELQMQVNGERFGENAEAASNFVQMAFNSRLLERVQFSAVFSVNSVPVQRLPVKCLTEGLVSSNGRSVHDFGCILPSVDTYGEEQGWQSNAPLWLALDQVAKKTFSAKNLKSYNEALEKWTWPATSRVPIKSIQVAICHEPSDKTVGHMVGVMELLGGASSFEKNQEKRTGKFGFSLKKSACGTPNTVRIDELALKNLEGIRQKNSQSSFYVVTLDRLEMEPCTAQLIIRFPHGTLTGPSRTNLMDYRGLASSWAFSLSHPPKSAFSTHTNGGMKFLHAYFGVKTALKAGEKDEHWTREPSMAELDEHLVMSEADGSFVYRSCNAAKHAPNAWRALLSATEGMRGSHEPIDSLIMQLEERQWNDYGYPQRDAHGKILPFIVGRHVAYVNLLDRNNKFSIQRKPVNTQFSGSVDYLTIDVTVENPGSQRGQGGQVHAGEHHSFSNWLKHQNQHQK